MDIQEIFSRRTRDKIRTTELIEALCDDEEKSWSSYNRGKPINPRQLAKQLEIYGIKPKTIRQPDGKTPKGYDRDQFADAFDRYLKAVNPSNPGGVGVDASPVPGANVAATPQRTGSDALDDFLADLEAQERGDVADTSPVPPGIPDDPAF
jgi:putative DNA primase/helicase